MDVYYPFLRIAFVNFDLKLAARVLSMLLVVRDVIPLYGEGWVPVDPPMVVKP